MSFATNIRVFSIFGRLPHINARSTNQSLIKVHNIQAMCFSSINTVSPSQLCTPDDPGWSAFKEKALRYKNQPPLSPHDLQKGQEYHDLNKKIEDLQKLCMDIGEKVGKISERLAQSK